MYIRASSDDFTCSEHNGNSVIDHALLSKGILDRIHKFSLLKWTSKSDHRTLFIDLKCRHMFDCEKDIEENK